MRKFFKNHSGATSIEYAVIMSIIFVGLLVAAEPIGDTLNNVFNGTSAELNAAQD